MTQPAIRRQGSMSSSRHASSSRVSSSAHARIQNGSTRLIVSPQQEREPLHHRSRSREHRSAHSRQQRSSGEIQRYHYHVRTHQNVGKSRHRPNSQDGASVTSDTSMPGKQSFRRSHPDYDGKSMVSQKIYTVSTESSPYKRSSAHSEASQNTRQTKKMIEDLSRAMGQERRIAAITNACAEFDHSDESRHNSELHYGAASILTKTLSTTDDDDEIRMICAAIEMVFRASAKYVHVAFDKVGSSMMPLLLRLLERCESGNMKHADVSILNITKTMLYLSRIPELRVSLARQQGMLDAMRRVATSILNPDCRISRTRIIANLANCEENKVLMFEHDGLLESTLRIGHLDLSERAREYASMALMDLASAPSNQLSLAKNDKLLGTLVKMILVEKIATTRESAITALQNLAFSKENRKVLVDYKAGIVLEALRKALSSDKNDKSRRRAAGALTNLACDETAEKMGSHKGLLDTLAITATKDENEEVQIRASLALTKIASSITVNDACHPALLDALVVASLSSAANSVSAVLRVKARDSENREAMARHPGVLDTLADICISPGSKLKDKDNAMRALMHLTNETSNRKVMCNKTILEALVKGASSNEPEMEDVRDSAVRAVERLATEFSNRPYMARHEGMLVAVAKAAEREAKLEESGAKVEHAFLAKPLLMSLLVAM